MITKKTIYILLPLIIIGIGVYFGISNYSFKSNLPNCVRLYTGSVFVEFQYPNNLISANYNNSIRVFMNSGEYDNKDGYINISGEYYQSMDSIIKNSLIDPGPKYEKVIFNGYEAAFGQSEDQKGMISKYYLMPFGNRVIEIDYKLPIVSENIYEKMLQSITLKQGKEDVKEPRVEKCD